MSQQYDNTNTGALFKNKDKKGDKHPDYKGSINVAGQELWLSAWLKRDRNGNAYMSLSVQPKGERQPAQRGPVRRDEPADLDDSIPF